MKRIAILLLCAVLLLFLFINSWKSVRGTICDFDEKTGRTTIPRKLRITYVQFFVLGIYFEKLSGYTDNIKRQNC
mgnify:CR=1 FL=1